MNQIKTRQSVKDNKVLDKVSVALQRMKTALIPKDQAENLLDDGQVSPSGYAEDKIQYAVEDVTGRVEYDVTSTAKKVAQKGKESYKQYREDARLRDVEEHLRNYDPEFTQTASPRQSAARRSAEHRARNQAANIRTGRNQTIKTAERTERTIKQTARSAGQKTVKTGTKGAVKSAEKTVKTAERTSKAAIKTAEVTAKTTAKAAQTAAKATQKAAVARQTAIAAYKAAVAAAKATAAAVKAIIAGVKALIAAIAAGGWVAVVVVIVICLIALIVGSCFGIFFSRENTGSDQTMQQVVQEINLDYQNQLDEIKASVAYDDLEMSGSRAVWPEVLSIYAVKTTTDPDNPQEVATMTEDKKQLLKDIFWEMNDISYRTDTHTETVIIETDDGNGKILEEETQETRTTLYITVSHKTAEQMALQYGFNAKQNEQLSELLADENNSLWLAVLYGVYGADNRIVMVALSPVSYTHLDVYKRQALYRLLNYINASVWLTLSDGSGSGLYKPSHLYTPRLYITEDECYDITLATIIPYDFYELAPLETEDYITAYCPELMDRISIPIFGVLLENMSIGEAILYVKKYIINEDDEEETN